MKHRFLLSICLSLCACVSRRAIVHAPPEEAEKVKFPLALPSEGSQHIQGNVIAAIQLAMDDFLPWDAKPSPSELADACLQRRESYDVLSAPGPDGVVLVQFVINGKACPLANAMLDPSTGNPLVDVTTYAIDLRAWRVLSIKKQVQPLKQG